MFKNKQNVVLSVTVKQINLLSWSNVMLKSQNKVGHESMCERDAIVWCVLNCIYIYPGLISHTVTLKDMQNNIYIYSYMYI